LASGGPVVTAHAHRRHEAQLARCAAGIPAEILDPFQHNMQPQAGLAPGGMRRVVSSPLGMRRRCFWNPRAPARMTVTRRLSLRCWSGGGAPMMSGLYLRRPEEARAAPIA
jgi:hypothetical protein